MACVERILAPGLLTVVRTWVLLSSDSGFRADCPAESQISSRGKRKGLWDHAVEYIFVFLKPPEDAYFNYQHLA